MDVVKKRKMDENGVPLTDSDDSLLKLSPEDARKIIERFTPDQLIDILQDAVSCHSDVLDAVRSVADQDVAQRKLFIRGLGWDTTTDGLRKLFSIYGELEEAVVILDKATGKSKGYGFVTFKHVDGALLALKEPSKTIDGRVTVTQLAAAGNTGSNSNAPDVSMRKIYVANVPIDMAADKLLAHFVLYGEIEEGPLGFDKQTGKCRGYALFVYKKAEGAQAALVDPIKTIEGRQVSCKYANDGKKGKPGGSGPDGVQGSVGNQGNVHGDGMGMPSQAPMPGSMGGQYGGPGGLGSYGGFSGGLHGPPQLGHNTLNSSLGPGLSSMGSQTQNSLNGTGGYGGGLGGGPYGGGYGGPGPTGFSGLSAGPAGGQGSSGAGTGSGLYRLPPNSGGVPSNGYPDSLPYSLSSSSGYLNQHPHTTGTSPAPRVPPGGMYPNVPPFY
ncbi:UBP1-associated protein 2C-like [Cucurbita pepo subsp. pepo]|uniref:UBP1-associated protein 2C-like n=1 Tax=Cucurbita pepo subsp. pepo TaxID=3664 RepID=UPI000C9D2C54|nr:UBP1-associated protein 2C-like [Cucurbita pepo subsp. pepo]XP_023524649.1 UBP1-associated protein 2C-like [Cucurbita pepo subsp. pepo]XP_023524650.1 UBP1-associated protein 2C-like [Cucurbita pepo subsp. pepo]XP_023524653.1 UBP1-associated protein 2C-like [Cucurbita pepo subsp. pepo]XP_023524654.1 UBP1-associated protein 2C-like [Cucurbita pepo subsp. pepo]